MFERRRVTVGLLAVAMLALALAPSSSGASLRTGPQLDVAAAEGDNFVTDDFSSYNIRILASSGPSGENPRGQVSFEAGALRLLISGPVSCLKVTGNTAILKVEGPFPSRPGFLAFIIKLTDNGGGGLDRFEFYPVLPEFGEPLDCETGAPGYFGGLLDGRALVSNASPAQCDGRNPAPCPDTDPPETTITDGPPDRTFKSWARFSFTSAEPNSTFECKLDQLGFSPCTSPARFKLLAPGRHRFRVRAIDAAGNVDPSPAKYAFRVLN
jgi:hypothetical protein